MTYAQIETANKGIQTMDVQGKAYATVHQRIIAFRKVCPNGSIETEILSFQEKNIVMKSTVKDDTGKVLGTGIAQEEIGRGFINKESAFENCESSAVGRALAMCGFGVDCAVASYEEMTNAATAGKKLEGLKELSPAEEVWYQQQYKVLEAYQVGYTKKLMDYKKVDKFTDLSKEYVKKACSMVANKGAKS